MKNEEIYSMMGHRNRALDQTTHSIFAFTPLKRHLIGKREGKTLFIYTRHSGTLPVSNSFIISQHTRAYKHTHALCQHQPDSEKAVVFHLQQVLLRTTYAMLSSTRQQIYEKGVR